MRSHSRRRSTYALVSSRRGRPEWTTEQRQVARQRDRSHVVRAAVDQQRVILLAEERGKLIHEPGGNAGRAMLGPLAGDREIELRQVGAQCDGAGDLECRARRKAGAGRHGGSYDFLEAAAAVFPDGVDVSRPALVDVVERSERHPLRRLRRDDALELDRGREDETVVVISGGRRLLTSTRRPDSDRLVAPARREAVEILRQLRHRRGRQLAALPVGCTVPSRGYGRGTAG